MSSKKVKIQSVLMPTRPPRPKQGTAKLPSAKVVFSKSARQSPAAAVIDILTTNEKGERSDSVSRVESKPSKSTSQSPAAAVSDIVATKEKIEGTDFLPSVESKPSKSASQSPATAAASDSVTTKEKKEGSDFVPRVESKPSKTASQSPAVNDSVMTKEKNERSDFVPRIESKPSKSASQSSAAALSDDVSRVASKLSSVLVEDSANQVEWIAEELRYIQTVLEDLDRGKGSNPDQLQLELVDELRAVALDAEDVIESFTIKPNKRRQKGVEYLLEKYEVGRELERISHRIREIRERIKNYEQTKLVVTIETPGLGRGATTMVSPALEKLDHILTQNLITLDEVIEKVEDMRDGYLWDAQNIVSNLISTGELSQREKVWLEEVKDLCDYTVDVAEKFIARTERLRDLWQVLRPSGQHAIEMNLMEQMECISTQFGDALYRRWTFGDEGKDMGDKIGSRSRPVTFTCLPLFSLSANLHTLIAGTVSLWRSLDENLKTTRIYLALMSAFFSDIESVEGLNQRQKVWVDQLRLVTRKGHSLVAAYPKEYGFLFLLSRIRFARDINYLLNEIIDISDRKNIYGIVNIQGGRKELVSSGGSEREIIIEVEHNDNSGREEIPCAPPDSFSYRHITELERQFQLIRGEKQLMDALFHDVQEIGYEKLDGGSKIWVDQMKGIARETEAVIGECDRELEQKPMLNNILESQTRFDIMNQINRIREKIKDASRSRKAYCLVQHQSRAESLRLRTQPFLINKKSKIVGFDEDTKILIAHLLSNEKPRCITSIVGIEGTGKTTLARLIFRHKVVTDHFDCRVWVSVSPSCTVEQLKRRVAKKAAKIIMGDQQDRWTTQVVLTTLASKKHLIIVDGIETPHVLDMLRETIPDRSTASRFLLTTRSAIVAQKTGTRSFVHPLRLLDDENSCILFTRNLRADIPLEPELAEVGRKIVAKCGGLPLEILKMSKLLSTEEKWSSFLEQPNQGQNPWSEALNTVNTNLPSNLRRCLLYFELFPADFDISVRRLVVLWVAEGLVHLGEDQEEPPELIAERYLTELIDLNMLQIAKRKPNGGVKTCRFPNPMREFLLIKANETRIPQVHACTDLDAVPKSSRIRQVVDRHDEKDIWHKHIHGNPTARDYDSLGTYYQSVISFLSFDARQGSKPGQDLSNFLNLCILSNSLLLLRVLDLEGFYKPKLPTNIAKLTRLRYLGLRWTYLESLPSSIDSLLQLQTLDLKHTYIHTLTSSIWKMKLRHLFLSETYRTRFPPKPIGVGNSLSDLQTLCGLFVDEKTQVKGCLDKLVNIRKLGLAFQSKSPQQEAMESQLDAVADWIVKLEYLQSLKLKSRDKEGRPWNLHLKSLENHINLTDMYLLGCLSDPSILSQFPPSLVELTLSHSKLEDDPMQSLKDLPNLRSLSLHAESYVGKKMFCNSESFPQLYVLKVWKLEQLEEWNVEQQALPSLRQLEIRLCPRMKMLPDGLKHVKSLLELKLTNMQVEINTDKHNIPPNCEVHRDDSAQFEEQFVYNGLS